MAQPGDAPAVRALSRSMRIAWRLARGLLAAVVIWLLVGAVVVAATSQGRTAVRTALFVPQILPGAPLHPQEWVTRAPVRTEVVYPLSSGEGGAGVADLYRPAGSHPRPGIVLFLGVNPAGRNDPRVVGLGEGLARAGLVVLIPWSETMTKRRIDAPAVESLVHAFRYLQGHAAVDAERVGMGGFCVGASLAAVAAADGRIRDDVRFLNFFGGYYDMGDLVTAISSRSRHYEGIVEPWEPDRLTGEVFTAHLIEGLEDEGERALMRRRFVDGDGATLPMPAGLSGGADAVYRLLSGATPAEAGALLTRLPAATRHTLEALSPRAHIDGLRARVLIMHDREDTLVPADESRRMADALAGRDGLFYTEFSFFQHVDPTRSVGWPAFMWESFKLFRHMYRVFGAAA